tara:strand:+ start:322 stop:1338 length:1017 start_codon:yes stop_codon:yes gene_type:complete
MKNNFRIRFARVGETIEIMDFIRLHWAQNHILAHDKALFNFQYLQNKKLNFVLALNSYEKIVGILGFIGYAPGLDRQDISLAMWKVIPNLPDPYLGVKLIHFLQEQAVFRNINCVGISKETIAIYKYLGFKTGKLDHYTAFNNDCKHFEISNPPSKIKSIRNTGIFEFKKVLSIKPILSKLHSSDFYKQKDYFKSVDFLAKRYETHPYFNYIFHVAYMQDVAKGLVISRPVEHGGGKALRIIEVIANDEDMANIINNFAKILYRSEYEYVDIYASGIDRSEMTVGHFELIDSPNDVIVPDYFEPYERRNTEILYMTSTQENVCLFKGDGDQDRPSRKI